MILKLNDNEDATWHTSSLICCLSISIDHLLSNICAFPHTNPFSKSTGCKSLSSSPLHWISQFWDFEICLPLKRYHRVEGKICLRLNFENLDLTSASQYFTTAICCGQDDWMMIGFKIEAAHAQLCPHCSGPGVSRRRTQWDGSTVALCPSAVAAHGHRGRRVSWSDVVLALSNRNRLSKMDVWNETWNIQIQSNTSVYEGCWGSMHVPVVQCNWA